MKRSREFVSLECLFFMIVESTFDTFKVRSKPMFARADLSAFAHFSIKIIK